MQKAPSVSQVRLIMPVKDFGTLSILDVHSKMAGKYGRGSGSEKNTMSPETAHSQRSTTALGWVWAHSPTTHFCTNTHIARTSCTDSPSSPEAAGEPGRNNPRNSQANVKCACAEMTGGTIHGTTALTSNKSFRKQSENITSLRNGVLILSLRSFSNACYVYSDPHYHTHRSHNTILPWKY